MVSLLYLVSLLIPHADDCYLSEGIIDPANNAELRAISYELANEENIEIKRVMHKLSCTPFITKGKSYVQKIPGTNVPIATKYCQFKNRLINSSKINKGVAFYKKHQKLLEAAGKKYNVDPSVITAIFGIETAYGAFLGKVNIKNALVDSAMNTPNLKKRAFFRNELKTLLKLAFNGDMEIDNITGSWDGAFGISQFMPSSYINHAVSEKNERPNLFDVEDAILSTANFLNHYGYTKDRSIATVTQHQDGMTYYHEDSNEAQRASKKNLTYRFLMDNGEYEYWEAGPNFYPVSAYNPRPHYVISIHLLKEAIHEQINLESQ